jgi:phosphohistidine phosphatase
MQHDRTVKRLHLLRHLKSSWSDPSLADHERPLAPRGSKAGKRLARWLGEAGVRPQLVVCSSAARAQATLELVRESLGDPDVVVEDGLYLASGEALLKRLRTLPEHVTEVLLVGHNPGVEDAASLLAAPGTLRDAAAEGLPTGAFVTLEGSGSWEVLQPGTMRLVGLVLPRSLG